MKLITLILALTAFGCAPTLSGKLALSTGEPIATKDGSINITSLKGGSHTVIVVTVNEDGEWATDADLAEGAYLVEALVPGYTLSSKRIVLGQEEDIEIVLTKLEQIDSEAVGVNLDGDVARGSGGATLMPPNL